MNPSDLRVIRRALKNVNRRARDHVPEAEIVGIPDFKNKSQSSTILSETLEISIGDETPEFKLKPPAKVRYIQRTLEVGEDEEDDTGENEHSELDAKPTYKPSRE